MSIYATLWTLQFPKEGNPQFECEWIKVRGQAVPAHVGSPTPGMIEITHNFDPAQFIWLWSKYVTGLNDRYHCTNCVRGRYSKKLTRLNPEFTARGPIVMDELREGSFKAIYICGVARTGYARKLNYPHNVHAAIAPEPGTEDKWQFEDWRMSARNERFLRIPSTVEELPVQYRTLPPEYVTCRIFRWAVTFLPPDEQTDPS